MRIAMFTDTYTPQINGVVTSIRAFRAELERQGHEVHIWAPAVANASKEKNVHRIRAFTFRPYPEYKISVPSPILLSEFKRIRADIVHVHSPVSVGASGLGIARYFGLPVVGTFHTMLPDYMHYLVKGRLQKLLMKPAQSFAWNWCRWFYNRCDAVIAPSNATAALLKTKGIEKPISVIPTGISKPSAISARSAAVFRKKWKLSGKVILHVGRVTREKNIEAIVDRLDELPDVTLAIASDGPHRAELQRYVRRSGLTDRVRFLGYLSKQELATAYKAADLFVCASQTETQGIVLLEAAATGLPVVALDAPVVSDFVRENNSGKIAVEADFAHAISDALGDAKLRKRVRGRAKAIAKRYDITKCTKDLIGLYKKCMAERA